jgi:ribonucleoside-diphosphate reductase alpha subunit
MRVKKRSGSYEDVSFDKIIERLQKLSENFKHVDCGLIAQKVVSRMSDGMSTIELDELSSQLCTEMITTHPEYGKLGGDISINNHHKNTKESFYETCLVLLNNTDKIGNHTPIINTNIWTIINNYKEVIENMIDYKRDYLLTYFGFKTLCKSYLLKVNGEIVERPQHLFMRVSIAIHGEDMERVKETYDGMSQLDFIHATPTLFNAGTRYPQLSSCFLLTTPDSVDGIFDTIKDMANISKWAGGIGKSISDIRAKGSYIRKTGGNSHGIIPLLGTENKLMRYINQSGRRLGSCAEYIEPWHADIFSFLNAKKNHGNEEERARDLFYGLWIPDLFMKCVEEDKDWYLMCPDECQGLTTLYGNDFEILYNGYVKEGRYRKKLSARDLFREITNSQRETGTPYMLYKDACNRKSNQKNLGTIKCSNLCTEIVEYSDDKEHAVCNLASIALSKCVKVGYKYESHVPIVFYTISGCNWCKLAKNVLIKNDIPFTQTDCSNWEKDSIDELKEEMKSKTFPMIRFPDEKNTLGYTELKNRLQLQFDHTKLENITRILTRNLNKIIDKNFYPTSKTELSNKKHRPIGIGVQGLADVFIQLGYPFDSDEARELNKRIFEVIYYSSLDESCNEAVRFNHKLEKLRNSHYNKFIHYDNEVSGKLVYTHQESPSQEYSDLFYSTNPTRDELNSHIGSYSSYNNSPMCQGLFQFDLWEIEENKTDYNLNCDWDSLRNKINDHGIRNSLLVAPMPTASTSQILGNNECIEPYTSNLYTRRTLSGEFTIVNKWLLDDLLRMGLWGEGMKQKLLYYRGSIQKIGGIPQETKDLYKTAWELKQKVIADLAVDRSYFIDQSQSLNVFFEDPTHEKLIKYHIYTWKKGLKTGSYYIRSKPAVNSQQFTIDPNMKERILEEEMYNYQPCEMCSA